MRKIFFSIICALGCLSSSNAQVIFEDDLDNVFAKAKLENKHVFIEYYNETCPICKKVEELWQSPTLSQVMNTHFISYKINTNLDIKPKDEAFLKQHKLFFKDVPNFIYFDKDGKFLHFTGGKADEAFIINSSSTALDPNKQAGTLAARIEAGDHSIGTLYQYSFLAQLHEDYTLVNSIANQLYQEFDKVQLHNLSSYRILKNAVYTTDNGFFKYWVNNQDQLANKETGAKKGQEIEVLKNIISIDLVNEQTVWTDALLNNLAAYMVQTNYSKAPEVLLVEKRKAIWEPKTYLATAQSYFKKLNKDSNYDKDALDYIKKALNI